MNQTNSTNSFNVLNQVHYPDQAKFFIKSLDKSDVPIRSLSKKIIRELQFDAPASFWKYNPRKKCIQINLSKKAIRTKISIMRPLIILHDILRKNNLALEGEFYFRVFNEIHYVNLDPESITIQTLFDKPLDPNIATDIVKDIQIKLGLETKESEDTPSYTNSIVELHQYRYSKIFIGFVIYFILIMTFMAYDLRFLNHIYKVLKF